MRILTGDSPVTACMPGARDCNTACRGVLAKMMVDKVVYTKRQPNTGHEGAREAEPIFVLSRRVGA